MKLARSILAVALCAAFPTAYAIDFFSAASNAASGITKNMAEGEKVANMSESDEIALGRNITGELLGKYRPIANDNLQRYVNNVGMWIALQSSRPGLPWKFVAVDTPSVNAFAVPGGTIAVTKGMLEMVSNEAELACVLGHEVAHITRKHHLTVLQSSLNQKGWIDAGVDIVGDEVGKNVGGGSAVGQMAGKALVDQGKAMGKEGFNKIATLRLDRGAESEADHDGILLAAKAGYDPGSCLSFMQRLASTKAESSFFDDLGKTHPPAASRANDIEASLGRLKGATPGEGARPPIGVSTAAAPVKEADTKKKKK